LPASFPDWSAEDPQSPRGEAFSSIREQEIPTQTTGMP
jgi:hypothetical protein